MDNNIEAPKNGIVLAMQMRRQTMQTVLKAGIRDSLTFSINTASPSRISSRKKTDEFGGNFEASIYFQDLHWPEGTLSFSKDVITGGWSLFFSSDNRDDVVDRELPSIDRITCSTDDRWQSDPKLSLRLVSYSQDGKQSEISM